jgi:kinesin family protein 4/21/27
MKFYLQQAKLYKSPTNGTFEEARQRSASVTSNLHKSTSVASLPSPPPAIPLPPLPTNATAAPPPPGTPLGAAAVISRTTSRELSSPQPPPPPPDEHENRIRSVENALHAEKQLNFALEEALADLENQSKKAKEDLEAWKKKAWAYEDEIETLKNSQRNNRLSMQAVEEARIAHRKAEAARAQLEERMNALNKKKKKSSLNCF